MKAKPKTVREIDSILTILCTFLCKMNERQEAIEEKKKKMIFSIKSRFFEFFQVLFRGGTGMGFSEFLVFSSTIGIETNDLLLARHLFDLFADASKSFISFESFLNYFKPNKDFEAQNVFEEVKRSRTVSVPSFSSDFAIEKALLGKLLKKEVEMHEEVNEFRSHLAFTLKWLKQTHESQHSALYYIYSVIMDVHEDYHEQVGRINLLVRQCTPLLGQIEEGVLRAIVEKFGGVKEKSNGIRFANFEHLLMPNVKNSSPTENDRLGRASKDPKGHLASSENELRAQMASPPLQMRDENIEFSGYHQTRIHQSPNESSLVYHGGREGASSYQNGPTRIRNRSRGSIDHGPEYISTVLPNSVAEKLLENHKRTTLSFGMAKKDNIMLTNCNKINVSGKIPFSFKEYQKVQLAPSTEPKNFLTHPNGSMKNSFDSQRSHLETERRPDERQGGNNSSRLKTSEYFDT